MTGKYEPEPKPEFFDGFDVVIINEENKDLYKIIEENLEEVKEFLKSKHPEEFI